MEDAATDWPERWGTVYALCQQPVRTSWHYVGETQQGDTPAARMAARMADYKRFTEGSGHRNIHKRLREIPFELWPPPHILYPNVLPEHILLVEDMCIWCFRRYCGANVQNAKGGRNRWLNYERLFAWMERMYGPLVWPAENNTDDEEEQLTQTAKNRGGTSTMFFELPLGDRYYHDGFFNVTVDFDRWIGPEGQRLDIVLPDGQRVPAYVERYSQSNGTARIHAGKKWRDYVQAHYALGDIILLELRSFNEIVVRRRLRRPNGT
jgi:hypothetical protein